MPGWPKVAKPFWVLEPIYGLPAPSSHNGDIPGRSVTASHRPSPRLIQPDHGHLARPANGAGCPAVARAAVTAKARERFSKNLFYFHMNRSRVGAWTESPFRGGPRRFWYGPRDLTGACRPVLRM
jgi:hypothetical protein